MCGVMGYVRTADSKVRRRDLLEQLMIGIQTRGSHAAGAACIGAERSVWGKAQGPASRFVKGQWWNGMMKANPRLLIGHARYATHGSPEQNVNNHPFVSADRRWMLVHNGVIGDHVSISTVMQGECDSEQILHMIEERGMKSTVNAMNEFTQSSFACLALDTSKGRLYAWRNERNPLVIADLTDQIGGMVICSTDNILRSAMIRAGLDTKGLKIYEFKSGYRYWFPIGCAGRKLADLPLDEVKGFDWSGYAGMSYSRASTKVQTSEERDREIELEQAKDADGGQSMFDYYKHYPVPGEDIVD